LQPSLETPNKIAKVIFWVRSAPGPVFKLEKELRAWPSLCESGQPASQPAADCGILEGLEKAAGQGCRQPEHHATEHIQGRTRAGVAVTGRELQKKDKKTAKSR
jgi:hypothetical protein